MVTPQPARASRTAAMFAVVARAGVKRTTEESVITSSPARSAPALEGMLSGPPPVGMAKSSESTACHVIADPPQPPAGRAGSPAPVGGEAPRRRTTPG